LDNPFANPPLLALPGVVRALRQALAGRVLIRATPLIRRGGFLPGAAAPSRGGVGATAPTISPSYDHEPTARPKVFRKSPGHELTIPEKDRSGSGTFFKKSPAHLQPRSGWGLKDREEVPAGYSRRLQEPALREVPGQGAGEESYVWVHPSGIYDGRIA